MADQAAFHSVLVLTVLLYIIITLLPMATSAALNHIAIQVLDAVCPLLINYIAVDHGHQKSSGQSCVSITLKPLPTATQSKKQELEMTRICQNVSIGAAATSSSSTPMAPSKLATPVSEVLTDVRGTKRPLEANLPVGSPYDADLLHLRVLQGSVLDWLSTPMQSADVLTTSEVVASSSTSPAAIDVPDAESRAVKRSSTTALPTDNKLLCADSASSLPLRQTGQPLKFETLHHLLSAERDFDPSAPVHGFLYDDDISSSEDHESDDG